MMSVWCRGGLTSVYPMLSFVSVKKTTGMCQEKNKAGFPVLLLLYHIPNAWWNGTYGAIDSSEQMNSNTRASIVSQISTLK